jgi:hypothetical protein
MNKPVNITKSMFQTIEQIVAPLEATLKQAIKDRDDWYELQNGVPSAELSLHDARVCQYATTLASINAGLMTAAAQTQHYLRSSMPADRRAPVGPPAPLADPGVKL